MTTRPALPLIILALLLLPTASAQRRRMAAGTGATATPVPMKGVVVSFHGTLKELSKKTIQLATDDNQLLSLRRTSKTKFLNGDKEMKPDEIDIVSIVTIDASEDNDMKLLAVALHLDPAQPAKPPRALATR